MCARYRKVVRASSSDVITQCLSDPFQVHNVDKENDGGFLLDFFVPTCKHTKHTPTCEHRSFSFSSSSTGHQTSRTFHFFLFNIESVIGRVCTSVICGKEQGSSYGKSRKECKECKWKWSLGRRRGAPCLGRQPPPGSTRHPHLPGGHPTSARLLDVGWMCRLAAA